MTTSSPSLITNHRLGIQLAAIGVLVLSFDALLIRLANADPWDVTFWRGLLTALSMFAIVLLRGRRRDLSVLRRYWKGMLLISTIYGVNATLFVLSIAHTSVANTVVILSSSAFFAAFFSWMFLRERVRLRTWMAMVVSVAGVITVSVGSFGLDSWLGDFLALLLALSMGLVLTLMRLYPVLPRMPMVALSGLVVMMLAIPFSDPLELTRGSYVWLGIMGLVQIPLASVMIMSATRYLSSPEVSLFLVIETVFGPFWVWLVLSEKVPPMTLVGGTAILGAIIVHSWLSLRAGRT